MVRLHLPLERRRHRRRRSSPRRAWTATFKIETPAGCASRSWHYPSRAECMVCHSRAANYVLGLCTVQMNKDHDYGGCTDNQLRVLEHLGLLKGSTGRPAREELADRATAKGLTDKEADEYTRLHGQQPGQREREADACRTPAGQAAAARGPLRPEGRPDEAGEVVAARELLVVPRRGRRRERADGTGVRHRARQDAAPGRKPVHQRWDSMTGALIAPAVPERSVLLKRISMRGKDQMPPLSTHRVDEAGVALIRDWIVSLKK